MNDQDLGTSVKKKVEDLYMSLLDYLPLTWSRKKMIEKGHSAVPVESIWRTGCLVRGNSMSLVIFIFLYFVSILNFP